MTSVFFFIAALLMLFVVDEKGYKFFAKFVLFASLVVPVTAVVMQKTIGASKSKALLANVLLLCISVTVVFVIAEFFVRLLFADITTTSDNTSYFALKWKKTNKLSLNSLGFREREIIQQKPADVYRIAIVGDSLTFGQGVAEDERFSNIIERKLNTGTAKYEVLNFGKPGAETIDHIRFLNDIFKINPDFILLQWFTNDVEGHDISARPRPYRLVPSDYLSGVLHRNSALYFLIKQRWNALQASMGLTGTYRQSMMVRFQDPDSDDSLRADRELNEFIKRVKNKNIAMGIVMFPQFVETGGEVDSYPFGFLFDRVISACRENAVKCIDMRPAYVNISPVSDLWVNKFDAHPSALANKVAADTILNALR